MQPPDKKYSPLCDVAWAGARILRYNPTPPTYVLDSYMRYARDYARKGFRL